ncbi:membrane protease [Subdoligranulum sp. DSM 109015]|uniref:Membrane protease n=1 Tax=Gemmiger gallinarum TaxID=2779354 RepID=A0ABR9R2B1_9FIRM|nr:prohibitin family protein [Gemmiger gallinarum]MBE5037292.1 membrane protease [Gemmiger gallinarum]
MSKVIAIVASAVLAVVCAFACLFCLERVDVGNVGVVYTANGVEGQTLPAGWHWLSPFKSVKQFPVSQQQIVFSNDPADYNTKEHADWSIDAPANGGMVKINLTVNYAFKADNVVDLYKRFNGMDGQDLVANYIQNSIIAYVKEVTPQFSVMDIYSDKKSDVNTAITNYLSEKLGEEYGINVISALVIDVQLDEGLQQKIQAKEQAKQDAEIAELEKQTAAAEAEVEKTKAQAEADVKVIEAQAEADSNRIIAQSITPELIQMTEAQARLKHGWVTVQGADSVVVSDGKEAANEQQ